MLDAGGHGVSRRRFIGYLLAAPVVVAGADLLAEPARAAIPTHQPVDDYDLTDFLTDATKPTSHLITVTVNPDGTVAFALPRAEVGEGITTAVAMTIADEMDLSVEKVNVTLADARPELVWNQLTGGSNSMHSIFTPVRVAAALAKGQLLQAAAAELGGDTGGLTVSNGLVKAPNGRTASFGSLTTKAAVSKSRTAAAQLKSESQFRLVGAPQRRIDAVDIVTGRKQFALDLDLPGALPTMVCRPPTINGTAIRVKNQAQVQRMPGVTDVAIIPHTKFVAGGVAVRARTFGQCIDAIRALDVTWGSGSVDGKSDADVLKDLKAAEVSMPPAN